MANQLILYRGPAAGLPTDLEEGEPAYTTDSKKLYLGDGTTNPILIGPMDYLRGFINRTDSVITWNRSSPDRTLTIDVKSPATQFQFYAGGTLFT